MQTTRIITIKENAFINKNPHLVDILSGCNPAEMLGNVSESFQVVLGQSVQNLGEADDPFFLCGFPYRFYRWPVQFYRRGRELITIIYSPKFINCRSINRYDRYPIRHVN